MRGPAEHAAAAGTAVAEEADRDKKRRRRQNRRSKQTLVGLPGGSCSSMDSVYGQPPEWLENSRGGAGGGGLKVGLQKAFNVGFSSLPAMHINDEGDAGGMTAGLLPCSVAGGEISRSCPLPNSSSPLKDPMDATAPWNTAKKYFAPYWSEQEVEEAIEKGKAFKATFRVNAYNSLESKPK